MRNLAAPHTFSKKGVSLGLHPIPFPCRRAQNDLVCGVCEAKTLRFLAAPGTFSILPLKMQSSGGVEGGASQGGATKATHVYTHTQLIAGKLMMSGGVRMKTFPSYLLVLFH